MKPRNAVPPHRRSIRLRGHDYSLPGLYYVTICTQGRELLFGQIIEGEMELGGAGQIVKRAWEILPQRFALASLDAFMIMPNHVHGIIQMVAPAITCGESRAHCADI